MHLYLTFRALVLHPSHKLEYFEQAGWDEEWRTTAEEILRTEFRRGYAGIQVNDDTALAVRLFFLLSFLFFDLSPLQDDFDPTFDNIFDALPTVSRSKKVGLADEIARYLSAPTEATLDPLVWWTERKDIYPRLSRMALDYLSIPGTSIYLLLNVLSKNSF